MLVVICTEKGVRSPYVLEEIRTFARLRRKIVPVDVAGSFFELRADDEIWSAVGGAAPEPESLEALVSGRPSDDVVERILKSIEFAVQDLRLRRAVWTVAAFLISSISLALYVSNSIVRNANARAASAEAKVREASAKAEEQQQIANMQQSANLADLARGQGSDGIVNSVSLAVGAGERAVSLGIHNGVIDTTIRNTLALLPHNSGNLTFPDYVVNIKTLVSHAAFSPDGKYVAFLSDKPQSGRLLKIRRAEDGKQLIPATNCHGCDGIAASLEAPRPIIQS